MEPEHTHDGVEVAGEEAEEKVEKKEDKELKEDERAEAEIEVED